MVVAGESSYPLEQIAEQAKAPWWYQVYSDSDLDAVRHRVQAAVKAGCKALCITLGSPDLPAGPLGQSNQPAPHAAGVDWAAIDKLRQGLNVPVVLKGVMTPAEAQAAVQKGIQGIVVSTPGGHAVPGLATPIEVLVDVADAVSGKAAILVDGGFRRGSDIMKALAMGAQGVLVARPPLWALAAYGADGVQSMMEMLQTELGRVMAMCGKVDLKSLDRTVIKVHRR
jgi:4-hydroxymandelate oxidase